MPGFLVDENLPGQLARKLRTLGFHVEHVSDSPTLRSSPDENLLRYARVSGLVIVSKDKDFSDLTRYPLGSHCGVVSIRLPNRMTIDDQVQEIVAAIGSLDSREMEGNLVVIEAGRIRLKRKPEK